jgi:hypothetical protein
MAGFEIRGAPSLSVILLSAAALVDRAVRREPDRSIRRVIMLGFVPMMLEGRRRRPGAVESSPTDEGADHRSRRAVRTPVGS